MRAILGLAMVVVVAAVVRGEEDLISDRYDYVDADEILANDRLREQYYSCFMDTGPCSTADQSFFKGNFAEVITNKCRRCTERQKSNFDKMADWYTKNQPEKWDAFVAKFVKEAQEKNAGS